MKTLVYVIIIILGITGYSFYTEKGSISITTDSEPIYTIDTNKEIKSSTSVKESLFIPNTNSIKLIMGLKKYEVLELLGKEYSLDKGQYEWQDEGYNYEQYGMTIYFDKYLEPEMIEYIDCNNKVNINGATVGMTFDEIDKILGKSEPIELEKYEPDQPQYSICYVIDNFKVWFGAGADGITTDFQLRRNYDIK